MDFQNGINTSSPFMDWLIGNTKHIIYKGGKIAENFYKFLYKIIKIMNYNYLFPFGHYLEGMRISPLHAHFDAHTVDWNH
jgi:hypothetical protein